MFVPSNRIPVGALPTAYVPSIAPSLGRILLTVLSPRFEIQMFVPSKAATHGPFPTGNVCAPRCSAEVSSSVRMPTNEWDRIEYLPDERDCWCITAPTCVFILRVARIKTRSSERLVDAARLSRGRRDDPIDQTSLPCSAALGGAIQVARRIRNQTCIGIVPKIPRSKRVQESK